MNFLRSTWFVAIIALVVGVGLQTYLLLGHVEQIGLAAEAPPDKPHDAPPTRIDWDFLSPEIEGLRTELRDRLAAVTHREEDLQDYEKRLKAERGELEKLKREIETVRDELSKRLIEIATSEQKNLKTLAATYSGMTPEAALAIFSEMDDEMVVKILAFMKPEPVGNILGRMAQTKDGQGSLAGRAAALSYKLRLLNQVKSADNS